MPASGLSDGAALPTGIEPFDEVDAFVVRRESPASWAQLESGYINVEYQLLVALRRGQLIAVHCEAAVRDRLLRWLDDEPRPSLERVEPSIFQGAFVKGEAKNLWLKGIHARRTTRPDSKIISGQRLQDALSPLEDSSFTLTSARSLLPDDPSRGVLIGSVGTSPRKALVWNGPTGDFEQFALAVHESFVMIDATTAAGGIDRPFPILVPQTDNLEEAKGAYDFYLPSAQEVAAQPTYSDEQIEAADLLEGVVLDITGDGASNSFALTVGLDGASAGVVGCTLSKVRSGVALPALSRWKQCCW